MCKATVLNWLGDQTFRLCDWFYSQAIGRKALDAYATAMTSPGTPKARAALEVLRARATTLPPLAMSPRHTLGQMIRQVERQNVVEDAQALVDALSRGERADAYSGYGRDGQASNYRDELRESLRVLGQNPES